MIIVCDKFIIIKWMQSGTILHIALLKKLSSHYPQGDLTSKYHHFKQNYATRCKSRSPKPPAQQISRPYQSSKLLEDAVYKPRQCRMERKFEKVFENWQYSDTLTAWNTDNQQQVSYTEKLKRDQYDFFPKLVEGQNKNRNKIKIKNRSSSKEMQEINNKINDFLGKQINKTPTTVFIKKGKVSPAQRSRKFYKSQDKENTIEVKPFTPFAVGSQSQKTRRVKSNDRVNSESPLAKNISNILIVKD